jgi:predicted amidophosphoribosyltransferase
MSTIRIARGTVAAAPAASGLRACPACSRQVSRAAPACPGCGEPFQEAARRPHGAINLRDPVHVAGIVVSGVVVLGAVLAVVGAISGRI